mgnify:CR=1 FL=1
MNVSRFEYDLPRDLIAQRPASPRDSSRLMIVEEEILHKRFYELPQYLESGDVLVLNDTKVIPARLVGFKPTGGRVKALLIREIDGNGNLWECFLKGRKIKPDLKVHFKSSPARVVERLGEGRWLLEFRTPPRELLERYGEMPLPPYIKREPLDPNEYQTVYAKHEGSIAAPTAGLHFTEELLQRIRKMGVVITTITLHVGPGTFMPVRTDETTEHRMHPEEVTITEETAETINERSGRLIPVGTTTLRALETAFRNGRLRAYNGCTDLFIHPPYTFRSKADALITNFHLPRSTLIMMVSAFAGIKRVFHAYQTAITHKYRFYSFGDAMLITREE